ncbi:MAG: type II secretion system F family protein [Acidobacteriia bacterium]|nr:type II secretion system F family protein [Terriglobia bacterium]
MSEFFYKATTLDGKLLEGSLDAANEKVVSDRLQQMGYLPLHIGTQAPVPSAALSLPLLRRNRVSRKHLLLFTRELSTLLQSGSPLDRSLTLLIDLTDNPVLKSVVRQLSKDLKSGKSFSEALSVHPKVFPKLYVNMVRAGEMGGFLNEVCERLAQFLEASENLRTTIVNAMIYPALLTVVGIVSIVILMAFVIPKFTQIFQDMGRALPLATVILMNVSAFTTHYGWMVVLGMIVLIWVWRQSLQTPATRLAWDRWILRWPVLGDLFLKIEVARFARTLGTLLQSAVPMMQAFNVVREIVGNTALAQKLDAVGAGIKKGEGVSKPVQQAGLFPPLMTHLLEVGEETGKLDTMLLQIGDIYDGEVRNALKNMLALLEPSIILVMGLIIGMIVLSILSAILSINQVQF